MALNPFIASKIIIEYSDKSVSSLEEEEAQLFWDEVLDFINISGYLWKSSRSIDTYLKENGYSSTLKASSKLIEKKWLIVGDVNEVKKHFTKIKYDPYGRAYIKSIIRPLDHPKGIYTFQEWKIIP